MADQNEERRLDDLLGSALSEYSAAEPRPGLEARILAHVREAAKPQLRWWSVRWQVAGAVGAGIVAIVLSVLFLRPLPKPQQVQVRPNTPPSNQAQVLNNRPAPGVVRKRQGKRATVGSKEIHAEYQQQDLAQSDRPSVFPTPAGLSEQEKLMLAYIAQTPKEEFIAQMRPPNPEEEEEFWKDRQPPAARPQR